MGRHVAFKLETRRTLEAPARHGMLFDATGRDWPACSLLVAPFEQGRRDADERELSGGGKAYFGKSASVRAGAIELPDRSLRGWQERGEVSEVYYQRAGTRAPGRYRHKFHAPTGLLRVVFALKSAAKEPAILYSMGRMYRLELPKGCIIDDRGIVLP